MDSSRSNYIESLFRFSEELKLSLRIRGYFWILWEDYKFTSANGKLFIEFSGELINESDKDVKAFECLNYLETQNGQHAMITGILIDSVHVPAGQSVPYCSFIEMGPDLAGHQKLRELKKELRWPLLEGYRINSRMNRLEFTDGSIIC